MLDVSVSQSGKYRLDFVAVGLGSFDRNIQFIVDGAYNNESLGHDGYVTKSYTVDWSAGSHSLGAKADGSWGWQWQWSYIDYVEITKIG